MQESPVFMPPQAPTPHSRSLVIVVFVFLILGLATAAYFLKDRLFKIMSPAPSVTTETVTPVQEQPQETLDRFLVAERRGEPSPESTVATFSISLVDPTAGSRQEQKQIQADISPSIVFSNNTAYYVTDSGSVSSYDVTSKQITGVVGTGGVSQLLVAGPAVYALNTCAAGAETCTLGTIANGSFTKLSANLPGAMGLTTAHTIRIGGVSSVDNTVTIVATETGVDRAPRTVARVDMKTGALVGPIERVELCAESTAECVAQMQAAIEKINPGQAPQVQQCGATVVSQNGDTLTYVTGEQAGTDLENTYFLTCTK